MRSRFPRSFIRRGLPVTEVVPGTLSGSANRSGRQTRNREITGNALRFRAADQLARSQIAGGTGPRQARLVSIVGRDRTECDVVQIARSSRIA